MHMKVLDERPTDLDGQPESSEAAAQALFEEARRLRRLRHRRWGILVTIVGVIAATIVVTLGHTGGSRGTPHRAQNDPTIPTRTAAIPREVVVWRNFRIEVVSSTTGRLIRTLAPDAGLNRFTPQPAVSPGGTVYFDEAHDVNGIPDEQILSVPLSGGQVTGVADGHDPAVSPDGSYLAYLTYADITNVGQGVAVRDLRTGATKIWRYSTVGPDITGLSWSPGSQEVSFTTTMPTPDNRSLTVGAWVLNASTPAGSLDAARKIPLAPGMAWAGYVNRADGIGVTQHWAGTIPSPTFGLSVVDATSGRVIARLPHVSGRLAVGNVFDGAEGAVQIDPSGQHLALVEVGSGSGALYRWTIGSNPNRISTDPVEIATGVIGAAWVPTR